MDMLLRTYGRFRGFHIELTGWECASYTEHDKSLSLTGCSMVVYGAYLDEQEAKTDG